MMIRQTVVYLIAALTFMVFVSANLAFGAVAENSDLAKLVSQYNDTHMTVTIWPSSWLSTISMQHQKMATSGLQSMAKSAKLPATTKLGTRN
jgi:hypothetical protein